MSTLVGEGLYRRTEWLRSPTYVCTPAPLLFGKIDLDIGWISIHRKTPTITAISARCDVCSYRRADEKTFAQSLLLGPCYAQTTTRVEATITDNPHNDISIEYFTRGIINRYPAWSDRAGSSNKNNANTGNMTSQTSPQLGKVGTTS